MKEKSSLKRLMLKLLTGSVVLGAIAGVVIILRGQWNWFEVRVMITTIVLAVASLCGLACDLSRTPRRSNGLPYVGMLLTFVTTVLLMIAIWPEFESEWYLKTIGVFAIFTLATVQVCLLSIARLAKRFSWVYLIAIQIVYGLAILASVMLVWEIDGDRALRFLAALSIVDAALSLLIPLLHRISRTDTNNDRPLNAMEERNVDSIDRELIRLRKQIDQLETLRKQITKAIVQEGGDDLSDQDK